jgi:patatin-related protein
VSGNWLRQLKRFVLVLKPVQLNPLGAPEMETGDPPADGDKARHDELRIALSMRGGVSLAVWIGGAVCELDLLTRATPLEDHPRPEVGPPDCYAALLRIAGYERASLDVITGASAGGLNGVVLAASRAYGFDFAKMLPLWVRLGDIELLTRDPRRRYRDEETGREMLRPDSLLKGDEFFQRKLREELRSLINQGEGQRAAREPFDLILSATLVLPTVESTDEDSFAPLPEIRRTADFHFRYLGRPGAEGGDFERADPTTGTGATSDREDSTVSLLALAGRATSSFPVAFEPAKVTKHAHRIFSDPPLKHEPPRHVLDGGVLDNIPVAKAIEAIAAAPVTGKPDRWLVFLHPSPGTPINDASQVTGLRSPRALQTLLITASTAFSQESLLQDLEQLRRHNARAREQRARRDALLCAITGTTSLADLADHSVLPALWMRGSLDAKRAVAIIEGERRLRRPIVLVDRSEVKNRLRAVGKHLCDDITEAYRQVLTATGGQSSLRPALVLTVPGLRLGCEAVSAWLNEYEPSEQRGAAALTPWRRNSRRLAELRTVIDAAQDWSDQAWLVASVDGPQPGVAWAEAKATLAVETLRSVPAAAMVALETAYPLGRGATDVLPVDHDPQGLRPGLEAVDRAMREVVESENVKRDATTDLGEWLFDRLVAIVSECADFRRPDTPLAGRPANKPFTVAQLVDQGRHEARETLSQLILVLSRVLTAEFESDDHVSFIRISGNNDTPLRSAFVKEGDPFGVEQKLCGNDLGNFAAFFSARWRANDWMWGRMDAAKSIVDLTIRPERLHRSPLDADKTTRIVHEIIDAAGMSLSPQEIDDLRVKIGAIKSGDGRTGDVSGLRLLLTEAMQRQTFAGMHRLIGQLGSDPSWPKDAPADPRAAGIGVSKEELDDAMRGYRVGSETLRDLDSKRRTEIGMRLAIVGYSALRPLRRGIRSRIVRNLMSIVKPLYLFAAFGALNVARAVCVLNLTAIGFWMGPWRYRFDEDPTGIGGDGLDARHQHQPYELLTGDIRNIERHGFDWPATVREWVGFVLVLLLSTASLVLAIRLKANRNRAKAERRAEPKGLLWYWGSAIAGFGALIATGLYDLRIGPLGVLIGAAGIALFTCSWMRWRPQLAVFIGTACVYAVVGLGFLATADVSGPRDDRVTAWFRLLGWMSVIALYAAMILISIICTKMKVLLDEEELLARAQRESVGVPAG